MCSMTYSESDRLSEKSGWEIANNVLNNHPWLVTSDEILIYVPFSFTLQKWYETTSH